jgi:hypothetical protein
MDKTIRKILDALIPRGGRTPNCIHVSLEDYLSRLSNLNRKLAGTRYRMIRWNAVCKEHKMSFDKEVNSVELLKSFQTSKVKTASYSTRSAAIENEFEVLLYSITSTLATLTRVVACFLKGSTQIHSHSKLPNILSKHQGFEKSQSIVANACSSWANELTERRDASTHYITLSAISSILYSKSDALPTKKTILRFGVAKKSVKYVSLWEDELPTLGGYNYKSMISEESGNKQETHELLDMKMRMIVRRDTPLPTKPELVDGEKYVRGMYKSFQKYVSILLSSLKPRLRSTSS